MPMAGHSAWGSEAVPPPGCDADTFKLFVGNLPRTYTAEQLLPFFESVGKVCVLCVVSMKVLREAGLGDSHTHTCARARAHTHTHRQPQSHTHTASTYLRARCPCVAHPRALCVQVAELALLRDKVSHEPSGSAFVWYASRAHAEAAILRFNLRHVLPSHNGQPSRPLVVRRANPSSARMLPNNRPGMAPAGMVPAARYVGEGMGVAGPQHGAHMGAALPHAYRQFQQQQHPQQQQLWFNPGSDLPRGQANAMQRAAQQGGNSGYMQVGSGAGGQYMPQGAYQGQPSAGSSNSYAGVEGGITFTHAHPGNMVAQAGGAAVLQQELEQAGGGAVSYTQPCECCVPTCFFVARPLCGCAVVHVWGLGGRVETGAAGVRLPRKLAGTLPPLQSSFCVPHTLKQHTTLWGEGGGGLGCAFVWESTNLRAGPCAASGCQQLFQSCII